jgi:uncharacterized protein YndB with AHSA1/START domain
MSSQTKETTVTPSSGTAKVTLPSDTEILVTREFDAPRELVWRTWTTPELVKRWWSGGHGEVTIAEIDLRAGGSWRYALQTEGGMEVAFHGEYREVVPNERIVTTEVFEGAPDDGGDPPLNLVTFEEIGERTLLTLLVKCPTREVRDMIIESGMEEGMQAGYDALEQVAISLR